MVSSGGISSSGYEDVSQHPFLTALRASFVKLYETLVKKHYTLLVPCAAVCRGIKITQVVIECHVLQSTHIPGNFLNLLGQGVELREGCVYTSFGFKEQRVCNVLQDENMYDYGTPFKVILIDRPLQGKFEDPGRLAGMLRSSSARGRIFDEASVDKTFSEWTAGNDRLHNYSRKSVCVCVCVFFVSTCMCIVVGRGVVLVLIAMSLCDTVRAV
eukprot:GHVQ01029725.1.p1 GENE.GHVQ01029725.1~~GHVQ01029725.1.p1  ORF type:complete len:214 (+),score=32.12 GHVQ01029725.1:130-771(+)